MTRLFYKHLGHFFLAFVVLAILPSLSLGKGGELQQSTKPLWAKCLSMAAQAGRVVLSIWIPVDDIVEARIYRKNLKDLIARDQKSKELIALKSKEDPAAKKIKSLLLEKARAEIFETFAGIGAQGDLMDSLLRRSGGGDLKKSFSRLNSDRLTRAIKDGTAVVIATPRLKSTNYMLVLSDYQIAFQYDESTGRISNKHIMFLTAEVIADRMRTKAEIEQLLDRSQVQPKPGPKIESERTDTDSSPLANDDQVDVPVVIAPIDLSYFELIEAAEEWLKDLSIHYPGHDGFLMEVALRVQDSPGIYDDQTFKSAVKNVLKKRLSDEESIFNLDSEIQKLSIRPRQIPDALISSSEPKLNEMLQSNDFKIDMLEPGKIYKFYFIDKPDIQHRVIISREIIEFMKIHRHGVRWLKYFLKPTLKHKASGLRTTTYSPSHPYSHSVAIMGPKNNYRVGVSYNKAKNLWTIEAAYDHDEAYAR